MATSGLALDRYFDFTIDDGGDVGTTSDGVEDLQKDLSVTIASVFETEAFGTVTTANDRAVLRSRIRTRVLEHELVQSVADVTVAFRPSEDTLTARVTAVTEEGSVVATAQQ